MVPVVVLVIVLALPLTSTGSVRVIVNVNWNGIPTTVPPPNPPIILSIENIPSIGPPGPGPLRPNSRVGGGPCAPAIQATLHTAKATRPAPISFFLTRLPSSRSTTIEPISPRAANRLPPPAHPRARGLRRRLLSLDNPTQPAKQASIERVRPC